MKTTIEVSARHIHLTKRDYSSLFGKEDLTKRNDLSQHGEFAAEETVEIVGPKTRIMNVRLLGPFRECSQLELSKTDCVSLGIDAPYLESGVCKGARIKVVGPKGEIFDDIAIIAMRHIHLSLKNASLANLKDGDYISVEIPGERATRINRIIVRVADNFANQVHLDTDDANACGVSSGMQTEIEK